MASRVTLLTSTLRSTGLLRHQPHAATLAKAAAATTTRRGLVVPPHCDFASSSLKWPSLLQLRTVVVSRERGGGGNNDGRFRDEPMKIVQDHLDPSTHEKQPFTLLQKLAAAAVALFLLAIVVKSRVIKAIITVCVTYVFVLVGTVFYTFPLYVIHSIFGALGSHPSGMPSNTVSPHPTSSPQQQHVAAKEHIGVQVSEHDNDGDDEE